MERGICPAHKNKRLECFCWECQSLVCQFCMQEHSRRLHKAFNLLTLSTHQEDSEEEEQQPSPSAADGSPSEPAGISELREEPGKPPEEKKAVPVLRPAAGPEQLCAKCGRPADPAKDVVLACTHCAHRDCLKEYYRERDPA